MLLYSLNLLLILSFIVNLIGCAAKTVNFFDAQKADTYQDLKQISSDIDCQKNNFFYACTYSYYSFDIFRLKKQSQQFVFFLGDDGKIVKRDLSETSIEYHILPQFKLPAEFSEFE